MTALDPVVKTALSNISFADRYRKLSTSYRSENPFEKYCNDNIMDIIRSFDYDPKFYKSENFFRVTDKVSTYEFLFNIKLKWGAAEFIWSLKNNNKKVPLGMTWGAISRNCSGKEDRIPLPIFETYEDLIVILKEAFSIYEDFKSELLKHSFT